MNNIVLKNVIKKNIFCIYIFNNSYFLVISDLVGMIIVECMYYKYCFKKFFFIVYSLGICCLGDVGLVLIWLEVCMLSIF